MKKDLDDALVRDFPNLYRDRHGDPRATGMARGFDVGDGWEPLLRRFSAKVEPLVAGTSLRAVQIKEKFAVLRIYLGADEELPQAVDGAINEAIDEAVENSARTCEVCGASGRSRPIKYGRLRTLCDACVEGTG